MKMKVIGKHSKDCYSVKEVNSGHWKNAWSEICPETRFGSKSNPFVRGLIVWLIFRCSCTYCTARLAVPSYEFKKGWKKK